MRSQHLLWGNFTRSRGRGLALNARPVRIKALYCTKKPVQETRTGHTSRSHLLIKPLIYCHSAGHGRAHHGVVAQSNIFCLFVYFIENEKIFMMSSWLISTTRLRNYVYLCKYVRNVAPTNVSTLCQLFLLTLLYV